MNAPSPTNTAAVVSLATGIASWVLLPFLAAIVAVIAGHMARGQIAREGGDGDGLALAGLVLGYLNIAFCVLLLFALVFGLLGLGWLLSQGGS
jgi:hypothetical protein